MATSIAPITISGGSHLKVGQFGSRKVELLGKPSKLSLQRKFNQVPANHKLSVRAEYSGNKDGGGGGGEFVAGFIVGGALFGTLAYVYGPKITKAILNEDEHGFRKARRPIYSEYDDSSLEKTRQTLDAKISQLNRAIDKVASRLRGGSNDRTPPVPVETDPEVEATK